MSNISPSTISDISDFVNCTFIDVQKVNGGKLLTFLLSDLAAVDCCHSTCNELAEYKLYVVAAAEQNDIEAHVCSKHYKDLQRLKALELPITAPVN